MFYWYYTVFTINISQKTGQERLLDGLECDAHHMAHELADGIVEAYNTLTELRHGVNSCPELLEVTALQNVSQVHNVSHLGVLQLEKKFNRLEIR